MRIQKEILAAKISRLKAIVPRQTPMAVLQGILISDGWMTATNMELTVKTLLEGADPNDRMIIPADAFDLISNLPSGELELTGGKDRIRISMDSIENEFSTFDPDQFPRSQTTESDSVVTLDADELMEHLANVLWAVAKKDGGSSVMKALCIDCHDGEANFVGLDGHSVAWDRTPYRGSMKMLIPRESVEALLKLDMKGDVEIAQDMLHSSFRCKDYIVETRLTDGEFFDYKKLFEGEAGKEIGIDRKTMIDAIKRAASCAPKSTALVLSFTGPTVTIRIDSPKSKYKECLLLDDGTDEDFEIAFNPTILENNLRAFRSEKLVMKIDGPKKPMILQASGTDLTTLALPVLMHSGSK